MPFRHRNAPVNALSHTTAHTVAALMKLRNVKQADIARVLGIGQPQVSRRLAGRAPFTLDDLEKLARYLEVPVAQLLEPPALLVDEDQAADEESPS